MDRWVFDLFLWCIYVDNMHTWTCTRDMHTHCNMVNQPQQATYVFQVAFPGDKLLNIYMGDRCVRLVVVQQQHT